MTTPPKKGPARSQICAITTSANIDDWRVVRIPSGHLRIVVLNPDGTKIGRFTPRDLAEYTTTLGKRQHSKLLKEVALRIVDIDEGRGVTFPIRNKTEETFWLLEYLFTFEPPSHRHVIFGPKNELFL